MEVCAVVVCGCVQVIKANTNVVSVTSQNNPMRSVEEVEDQLHFISEEMEAQEG